MDIVCVCVCVCVCMLHEGTKSSPNSFFLMSLRSSNGLRVALIPTEGKDIPQQFTIAQP